MLKRSQPVLRLGLLCSAAVVCVAQQKAATLSGTIRDAHGTPQMGVVVEVIGAAKGGLAGGVIARTFSDERGRYIVPTVDAGNYMLRATGAFFLPLQRPNVRLTAGQQSIVNLTLSAMFEAAGWLPTERRRADEPVDDWKWTLRADSNRPLLRLTDEAESAEGVSSSAQTREHHAAQATDAGRIAVLSGDGQFGSSGQRQQMVLTRSMEDGDAAIVRADFGDTTPGTGLAPSVVVSAGYERRGAFGSTNRLVASVQSHPELTTGAAPAGLEVFETAATDSFKLGDAVVIDAGTLFEAEKLLVTRVEALPYLRIGVTPDDDYAIEYRFATGRELQSSEDLDRLKPTVAAVTDAQGRPLNARGMHQEITLSRKLGSRAVSVSVYQDTVNSAPLNGGGASSRAALGDVAAVSDALSGRFQVAAPSYSGRGLRLTAEQNITPLLSLWVEYDLGTALRIDKASGATTLADALAAAHPEQTQAAAITLRGRLPRTGSTIKGEYRWQPEEAVTAVNWYNTAADEAYMSVYLRQHLFRTRLLPQGVDAVVEATNLLAQGYRPVVGPDGTTLYLTQVPRAVQGGLAFNF